MQKISIYFQNGISGIKRYADCILIKGRNMKKYSLVIILLMLVAVNMFFRLKTVFLPSMKFKAKSAVDNLLAEEAAKHVDEKFKDLSPAIRAGLTNDFYSIWKKDRKNLLAKSYREKEEEFRKYYLNEKKNVFLLELDPYHWYRLVRNYVNTGSVADEIISKKPYDSYMLAPIGMKAQVSLHRNLHVYIAGFIYKGLRLLIRNIALEQVLFFIPVFISVLSVLVVFFCCRNISGSNIPAFFAGISLGIAPIYLTRSMAGWFDTDPYVILFSVLVIWSYYISIKKESSYLKSILFSFLASLCMALFAFAWDGWWYIFDIVIIATLYYLLNLYLLKNEFNLRGLIQKVYLSMFLFFFLSLAFICLFALPETAADFFTGPKDLFFAYKGGFWPNTFLTVAELSRGNPQAILRDIGGGFILFFAVVYLLIALSDKKSAGFINKSFLGILFSFLTIVLYLVSLKARRFSLLLSVPLCMCFGLFMERAYVFLKALSLKKIKSEFKIDIILIALSSVVIFIFLNNARFTAGILPLMNRDWYEVLNKIKKEAPKEAIINSWWDYGHWFKAVADRRVIFDGATQNTPMAHWMGRALVSSDEEEAAGILRMLNSSSNKAFEKLEELGFDKLDSYNILNGLLKLNKAQAGDFLKKYIPQQNEREELLKYLYNPEPAYFIIESTLLYKIKPISFLGSWDFVKADIYKNSQKLSKEQLLNYIIKKHNFSREKAEGISNTLGLLTKQDIFEWISPPVSFYSESKKFEKKGNFIYFDTGLAVDLSNYETHSYNQFAAKWTMPKSVFYFDGKNIKEVNLEKSSSEYSVLLLNEQDDYKAIILDEKLARSMLVRLYYLKAKGLKYFQLFLEKDLENNQGKILVYKISWNGQK